MKLALDPYMFRRTPVAELPGMVADLGYRFLELSPPGGLPAVLPAPACGRRDRCRVPIGAGRRRRTDRLRAAAVPLVGAR